MPISESDFMDEVARPGDLQVIDGAGIGRVPVQAPPPRPVDIPFGDTAGLDLRVGPNEAGREAIWLVEKPSTWVEVMSKTDLWFALRQKAKASRPSQRVADLLWSRLTSRLPAASQCPEDGCTVLTDSADEPCGEHYLALLRDQADDMGRVPAGEVQ